MVDYRPDKAKMAQSFAAAAAQYDDVAVLQRQTADELLERLSLTTLEPETILDLGAGTGRNLALLQQRYPQARLLAMDIAPGMLTQATKRYRQDLVCAASLVAGLILESSPGFALHPWLVTLKTVAAFVADRHQGWWQNSQRRWLPSRRASLAFVQTGALPPLS
jgi:SAM-dependent methyltransferase